MNLDVEVKLFLEHSSVRWLSIGPSVRRVLEQRPAIVQFVKFLEADSKRTPQSGAFKRVQAASLRALNMLLINLEYQLKTLQMCLMNGDYTCTMKMSRSLRKAQELTITGVTLFSSRQQMQTQDTLC